MQRIILVSLLALFACQTDLPTAPDAGKDVAIHMSIPFQPNDVSANTLSRMVLEVYGAGMDTLRTELTLYPGGAKGQINVPVGNERVFTARGYMDSTLVLMGSTTVDLKEGQNPQLEIILSYMIPTIIVTPPQTTISLDSVLSVFLDVRQVSDLATLGAELHFDNTMLEVVDLEREDDFLESAGGTVVQMEFEKDNVKALIKLVLSVFPSTKAVTGGGHVARIDFRPLKKGTTQLILSTDNSNDTDLGLLDKTANVMQSLALGSQINIE